LIAERPGTVIEIGLAYGSSALAIGEAPISVGGDRHVILDPFQDSGFRDAGWEVIRSAQLDGVAMLLRERSQIALPWLAAEGIRVKSFGSFNLTFATGGTGNFVGAFARSP
jgi:hypothetical protein